VWGQWRRGGLVLFFKGGEGGSFQRGLKKPAAIETGRGERASQTTFEVGRRKSKESLLLLGQGIIGRLSKYGNGGGEGVQSMSWEKEERDRFFRGVEAWGKKQIPPRLGGEQNVFRTEMLNCLPVRKIPAGKGRGFRGL